MTERKRKRPRNVGKDNPMYGKTHTPEALAKISAASAGRCHTDETKRKLSLLHKGIQFTPEHCAKISTSKKGKAPWNKGKKGVYRESTIEKLKAARANQKLPLQDTKPEKAVQRVLVELGIEFRKHARIPEVGHHQFDMLINEYALAVEVDGCYWHACPQHCPDSEIGIRNNRVDKDVDEKAEKCGWRVLRIWEHDVKDAETIIAGLLDRMAPGIIEKRGAK